MAEETTDCYSGTTEEKEDLSLNRVKQSWREQEDFGMAYQMQYNEFSDHYGKNREERQQMRRDSFISKEDKFAAVYYEHAQANQLKEDERMAVELQRKLEAEDMARYSQEKEDRMLASQLQEMEIRKKQSRGNEKNGLNDKSNQPSTNTSANNASIGSQLKKSPSGNRLVLPPGITPELLKAIDDASGVEPIQLPPGLTLDQYYALKKATVEEDRRMASELQDAELAKFAREEDKPDEKPYVKPSELMATTKKRGSKWDTGRKDTVTTPYDEYAVILEPSNGNAAEGTALDRIIDK